MRAQLIKTRQSIAQQFVYRTKTGLHFPFQQNIKKGVIMDPVPIDGLANMIQSLSGSAFVAMVTIAFLISIANGLFASNGSGEKRR